MKNPNPADRPQVDSDNPGVSHEIVQLQPAAYYAAVPRFTDEQLGEMTRSPEWIAQISDVLGGLELAFDRAASGDDPWVKPGTLHDRLFDLAQRAQIDSLLIRMIRGNHHRNNCSPMLDLAHKRLASPAQLVELLKNDTEMLRLNIAVVDHPLSYDGVKEMDDGILEMLLEGNYTVHERPTEYRKAGPYATPNGIYPPLEDLAIPAIVVEQKVYMGQLELAEGGKISIVRRQRLLVRGDADACGNDASLAAKIVNPTSFRLLRSKIVNSIGAASDGNPYYRWIQPLSTLYYAAYEAPAKES